MELSKLKGIFTTKSVSSENFEIISTENKKNNRNTFPEYGFNQASRLGGTIPGLNVCLHKIYQDFKQEIKDDTAKQNELKRPYTLKIEERKGDIDRLEKRIEKVSTEEIPETKEKIEQIKEDISYIRENPQEITGDKTNKVSFFIGVFILMPLTIYLLVFYSSASYSAFFKEFKGNETGIATSIFDAKAIENAFRDGITELILILTIPFVFIALGYLIHKFQENKEYLKITVVIIITFVFDSILAYEITEKIYNLSKTNSFQNIVDYSIPLAFRSVNFWLIIFAGFIVYLVWGFIFDFVMEAYGKIDKLGIAIREKEKQRKDLIAELDDLNMQVEKMTQAVAEHNTEINKLNKLLENSIIPKDFELHIFSFMEGWMSWMKQSGKEHRELEEAGEIVHQFVSITTYDLEEIKL